MTNDKMHAIEQQLASLTTIEEVRYFQDALRARWQSIQRSNLRSQVNKGLDVGAKVVVDLGRKGGKVPGTVTKINLKSVTVDTPRGSWKVGASLVTLVEAAPAAAPFSWDEV